MYPFTVWFQSSTPATPFWNPVDIWLELAWLASSSCRSCSKSARDLRVTRFAFHLAATGIRKKHVGWLESNLPALLIGKQMEVKVRICLNRFTCAFFLIHPRKLTWNLKMRTWKRKNIYKPSSVGFQISFVGCAHCGFSTKLAELNLL